MDIYWFTVRSQAVTVQKKPLPPPPVYSLNSQEHKG